MRGVKGVILIYTGDKYLVTKKYYKPQFKKTTRNVKEIRLLNIVRIKTEPNKSTDPLDSNRQNPLWVNVATWSEWTGQITISKKDYTVFGYSFMDGKIPLLWIATEKEHMDNYSLFSALQEFWDSLRDRKETSYNPYRLATIYAHPTNTPGGKLIQKYLGKDTWLEYIKEYNE